MNRDLYAELRDEFEDLLDRITETDGKAQSRLAAKASRIADKMVAMELTD